MRRALPPRCCVVRGSGRWSPRRAGGARVAPARRPRGAGRAPRTSDPRADGRVRARALQPAPRAPLAAASRPRRSRARPPAARCSPSCWLPRGASAPPTTTRAAAAWRRRQATLRRSSPGRAARELGARDRDRRRHRRARRSSPRRACPAVADARAQPRVVDDAARCWPGAARRLRRQRAGLAVLPRPGAADPVARHVRQAQRAARRPAARRRAAPSCSTSCSPLAAAARRRHGLGVRLPLRRRQPAVDQRPRPGHRAAGARARRRSAWRDAEVSRSPRARLAIFQAPPPAGVRVRDRRRRRTTCSTPSRRTLRILNGFVQSLVGLYDYAHAARTTPTRAALFAAGEREAAREVPTLRHRRVVAVLARPTDESDLNYHELLRDFLTSCATARRPPVVLRARQRFTPDLTTPPRAVAPVDERCARRAPARCASTLDKISRVGHDGRRGNGTVRLDARRSSPATGPTRSAGRCREAPATYTVTLDAPRPGGQHGTAPGR